MLAPGGGPSGRKQGRDLGSPSRGRSASEPGGCALPGASPRGGELARVNALYCFSRSRVTPMYPRWVPAQGGLGSCRRGFVGGGAGAARPGRGQSLGGLGGALRRGHNGGGGCPSPELGSGTSWRSCRRATGQVCCEWCPGAWSGGMASAIPCERRSR